MERGVSWLRCNNCGTAGVESYAGSTPGGVTYKRQYRACEGAISIGPTTSAPSTLEGRAREAVDLPASPTEICGNGTDRRPLRTHSTGEGEQP